MSSDFINLTSADGDMFINAYRVNAVYADREGGSVIEMNVTRQLFYCDENPAEVVAMIDKVVNGQAVGSQELATSSFIGRGLS